MSFKFRSNYTALIPFLSVVKGALKNVHLWSKLSFVRLCSEYHFTKEKPEKVKDVQLRKHHFPFTLLKIQSITFQSMMNFKLKSDNVLSPL